MDSGKLACILLNCINFRQGKMHAVRAGGRSIISAGTDVGLWRLPCVSCGHQGSSTCDLCAAPPAGKQLPNWGKQRMLHNGWLVQKMMQLRRLCLYTVTVLEAIVGVVTRTYCLDSTVCFSSDIL